MRWMQSFYSRTALVCVFVVLLISQPPSTEASIRLCGQRLTTTLIAICRNQLCGGMSTMKRSPQEDGSWAPTPSDLFQLHHLQKRGGIATECCEKRCSFAYLKTYCCNDDDDKFF